MKVGFRLLCNNLIVRGIWRFYNLMRPQMSLPILLTAHTFMLFSDLFLLDLNLINVNLTVLLISIAISIISELSLIKHLEILNAKFRLIPTLEVVVQFLLIQEGVLAWHLLIKLEVRIEFMMSMMSLLTRDPTRVLK